MVSKARWTEFTCSVLYSVLLQPKKFILHPPYMVVNYPWRTSMFRWWYELLDSQSTLCAWPLELGLGTRNPRFVAWPLELGLGTRNPRFVAWSLELGLGTLNPRFVAWPLELWLGTVKRYESAFNRTLMRLIAVCLLLLLLLLLTPVLVCRFVASGMQCLLNIPKMLMVNCKMTKNLASSCKGC